MNLKSIINTISNDKVLSILTLFSVILICTLLYYNLSDKLLNITANTQEYFADGNMNCDPIRLLTDQEQLYVKITITDEEGTIKKHIIVDEDEKLNIHVDMTIDGLNTYLNKLNEDFEFDNMKVLFTEPKNDDGQTQKTVTEIKDIIKDRLQKRNINLDTIESIMGTRYDNEISEILEAYLTSQINDYQTKTSGTKYYERLYISKLYKLILTLIVSIDIGVTEQKVQTNMEKANIYINNLSIYRPYKRRAKNNLKKLIKLYLVMSVISNEELFQNTIEYNLLSNYEFDNSGELLINTGNSEVLETGIQIFTIKNNLESLTDFVKENSGDQIKNVINRFGNDLNTLFKTTNITYEHIFNLMSTNSSIVKKYTDEEYTMCDQVIQEENAYDLGSY
jgi:hypothetical protein